MRSPNDHHKSGGIKPTSEEIMDDIVITFDDWEQMLKGQCPTGAIPRIPVSHR
jgi:hypothetical protein